MQDESTGAVGSYTRITKAPNRFSTEIVLEPERWTESYNGKSAWARAASSGAHTLIGAEASFAEATARYFNWQLANYKKNKIALTFRGRETIAGRQTDHVELAFAPGVTREIFIDAQTHLIARETGSTSRRAVQSGNQGLDDIGQYNYSDYRAVNGVQIPYKIELHRDGHNYLIHITRVELNAAVADAQFDFPRADNRPLPDIPALLLDMAKNQKAIDELQKQYTCHLTEEEERTDSKGRVTSDSVKEYDIFYVGGDEVRHLIAKNGAPLTGADKKDEDDKFNKHFDELQRKQAELASDPKKQAKQDQEDQAQISDFLRAEKFTNPRRERFRGQGVIVFDFGPNPDYQPRKLVENIVQKLVGVVWVDERARDVVRLQAQFSDNVKIGGGILASLQKGSNFVFEQTKLNNEVWLPSYAEVHAGARLLFFKLKANEIDRYTDYKKFGVETKLGPASPAPSNTPN